MLRYSYRPSFAVAVVSIDRPVLPLMSDSTRAATDRGTRQRENLKGTVQRRRLAWRRHNHSQSLLSIAKGAAPNDSVLAEIQKEVG